MKIFRKGEKEQVHKEFIAANRIYKDEENALLCDHFDEKLVESGVLLKLASCLK